MTSTGLASRISFSLSLAALVATSACREDAAGPREVSRKLVLGRGDAVVVEQTAAVFFEGRVLAADGERLRVQAADDQDTLTVAASDVYPLPAPSPQARPSAPSRKPGPGEYAICRNGPRRWQPCRIERPSASGFVAVGPRGEALEVPSDGVLGPSPVTELNLRRHFERTRERLDFAAARARAGEPAAPPSYRPILQERVLARGEGGWYTAYVREIDEDGVRVAWQADRGISTVALDAIVPEPPYTEEIRRGDFVLVRPVTPASPWQPMLVRSAGNGELRIVDIEGRQRSVSVREVVPLGQG